MMMSYRSIPKNKPQYTSAHVLYSTHCVIYLCMSLKNWIMLFFFTLVIGHQKEEKNGKAEFGNVQMVYGCIKPHVERKEGFFHLICLWREWDAENHKRDKLFDKIREKPLKC